MIERFGRVYRACAIHDSITTGSDATGATSRRFQLFFIPVPDSRIHLLRRLLYEACAVYGTEEIFLSIAGHVEYIQGSSDEAIPQSNPWAASAGIWKDRPDLDDFLENISEYRRQIDETESDG